MKGDGLFGWRDRSYESIPQDHVMTRAVWLTAALNDLARKQRRQVTAPDLVGQAFARMADEDFALTPPPGMRAAGSN